MMGRVFTWRLHFASQNKGGFYGSISNNTIIFVVCRRDVCLGEDSARRNIHDRLYRSRRHLSLIHI